MTLSFSYQDDAALWQRRFSALNLLARREVQVGLPSCAPQRSRTLLAIHEHGSPLLHIPARPVIVPGVNRPETRAEVHEAFQKGFTAALAGDLPGVAAALEKAGKACADGVRAYIDAGVPPPNAPVTVHGGVLRNPVSGKSVLIEGKGFSKPLVDSGELYRSISYKIVYR